MNKLTVLYDASCGFCVKCRWWIEYQPKLVEVEMLPARGTDAWLLCLWALEDYREGAERLASPLLRPFARGAFATLSAGRKKLSKWFAMETEELADEFRRAEPPRCVE